MLISINLILILNPFLHLFPLCLVRIGKTGFNAAVLRPINFGQGIPGGSFAYSDVHSWLEFPASFWLDFEIGLSSFVIFFNLCGLYFQIKVIKSV